MRGSWKQCSSLITSTNQNAIQQDAADHSARSTRRLPTELQSEEQTNEAAKRASAQSTARRYKLQVSAAAPPNLASPQLSSEQAARPNLLARAEAGCGNADPDYSRGRWSHVRGIARELSSVERRQSVAVKGFVGFRFF